MYPSHDGSDDQVYQKKPREDKKFERKRKSEGMRIRERLSRIVDRGLAVPPPVPMVFEVRSCVRAALISLLYWGWDEGQIAS